MAEYRTLVLEAEMKYLASSLIGGHLHIPEMIMFLVIGAFLGQYGNILVGLFQQYLNPKLYQKSVLASLMEKHLELIFWMGIIAPLRRKLFSDGWYFFVCVTTCAW